MNSANNAVGAYASYFTQGTAAANNSDPWKGFRHAYTE